MPPYLPRKRLRGQSPTQSEQKVSKSKGKGNGKGKAKASTPRKPTLFDDLDGTSHSPSLKRNNSAIKHLEAIDNEDDSSLTSLSDADFEDVHIAKRQKVGEDSDEDDDEDDEDIEFEDVQTQNFAPTEAPMPSGDLELTLTKDTRVSMANLYGDKKGPTKRERLVRNATHCVHVQTLLWHNAVRNSWLCDPEVQGILISHLPSLLWDEVDKWRRNSGLEAKQEKKPKKAAGSKAKGKKVVEKPGRDWGQAASRLEDGVVDMSHGDPLLRLMKALSAWWKKRFQISAPGARKIGYMTLERLDRLTKAFKAGDENVSLFGEKITNIESFRDHARQCTGSRDVGAQLFTALLRGLGLEARMVANLQPLGFGWNKMEDAEPEKDDATNNAAESSKDQDNKVEKSTPTKRPGKGSSRTTSKATPSNRSSQRNSKRRPEVEAEDDTDDLELIEVNSDNDSVVEVLPSTPRKNFASYDKDLTFPHYWTEVLSPVTNNYLAVDAIVKAVIATNRELIESLEPRGAKADKSRQVMAYVVGFSADGSAKDVTVRYLKRQTLPGRTKGVRMPTEKIPIYNKHGKVKSYEQFDWFKLVMRGYRRGGQKTPITEIDEQEDSTDLKPAKPEKKEVKEGEETLQYYKQSKEFVLERHLKREEALLPDAPPVKVFKGKGKGDDAAEENVYLRKDVVNVKSAETWHKQGRAPLEGEEPLKRVPYRAATTNRRREIAEAEAATGGKVLQGLYSFDQTDWIIPPPIENGIIPKNSYGNIDLFAEHMCPKGAVHVPYRAAMRVCKRMEIDYAEAVVDFEFGHRMAVPVIQGVVIAEEYHDQVMQEIAKDEAERSRKEDEKRRKAALDMWRKMVMGMRIAERIRQDYGELKDDDAVFGHSRRVDGEAQVTVVDDEDMAGGFLPEGFEEEEEEAEEPANQVSSFFPVVQEDDEDGAGGDSLFVEDDRGTAMAYPTPQSGTGGKSHSKGKKKTASKPTRRRRRRAALSSDEEDDMDVDMDSDADYEG